MKNLTAHAELIQLGRADPIVPVGYYILRHLDAPSVR
jgi:hypothetical protein